MKAIAHKIKRCASQIQRLTLEKAAWSCVVMTLGKIKR